MKDAKCILQLMVLKLCLEQKIWDLVPNEIKQLGSLNCFKLNIKKWIPQGCTCRLYKIYTYLTLFKLGWKKAPSRYQFFSCNLYKRRNYPIQKTFCLLVLTFLPNWFKILGTYQCQSQITELEPRPYLKKAVFLVKSL